MFAQIYIYVDVKTRNNFVYFPLYNYSNLSKSSNANKIFKHNTPYNHKKIPSQSKLTDSPTLKKTFPHKSTHYPLQQSLNTLPTQHTRKILHNLHSHFQMEATLETHMLRTFSLSCPTYARLILAHF